MTWTCKTCGAEVDDDLAMCWQCGAGQDGSPPPEGWRSELAEQSKPAPRDLACLRCSGRMAYLGAKRFYEGSYSADILFGDFFIHREEFEVYLCQGCGKVEFFAPSPTASAAPSGSSPGPAPLRGAGKVP